MKVVVERNKKLFLHFHFDSKRLRHKAGFICYSDEE